MQADNSPNGAPSANEDRSPANDEQHSASEPPAGAASAFSSPSLPASNSATNLRALALQHTISNVSAPSNQSGGIPSDSLHTQTPLLNGENIVLLSFSNDTTPADTPFSNNTPEGIGILPEGLADQRANFLAAVGGRIDEMREHETSMDANDMTLSPSSLVHIEPAHSPPPDSIHSGQLTTLSPPPISARSSNTMDHHTTSGSQSLFSRGDRPGSHHPPPQQQQPPTVASAPSKKRPPLPPRWALPGNTGIAASHHAGMVAPPTQPLHPAGGGDRIGMDVVDVVPGHLPPPKQIGPLSHRRVLSTGDASFLSNLTDPDSGMDGEGEPSPGAAAGAAAGTAAGVVSYAGVGPLHTVNAEAHAPNAAGASPLIQPLPKNPARMRGVSWDFGPTGVAASHSESLDGSVNRYKNEEEAAFDTLGILQPILSDDGDNANGMHAGVGEADAMDLMQPILMDEEHEEGGGETGEPAIGGMASALANSATEQLALPPPPPPPPEKVVRQKSETSRASQRSVLEHMKTISSKDILASKKGGKDHTQFEDEAEMAILEALNVHNLAGELTGTEDEEENEEEKEVVLENIDEALEDNGDDASDHDDGTEGPMRDVLPSHRKDVSALTSPFSFSPNPNSVHSRKRGESIFEDAAWTEEYDAAGRIDGSLPEEKESKLVEEELGVDLKAKVGAAAGAMAGAVGKAAGDRPPLHPITSPKSEDSSHKSNPSKMGVKEVKAKIDKLAKAGSDSSKAAKTDSHASNHPPPMDAAKDPTATTGLRHRRSTHIAAKDMADEIAQIAAMHSGERGELAHKRSKTGLTALTTDNLFAGVDVLAQQKEARDKKEAGGEGPTEANGTAEEAGDDSDDDGPHDEETGEATKPSRRRFARDRRTGKLHQRGEKMWHLRVWYHDIIEPKLPAFREATAHSVVFVIVPLLVAAFILFYGAGNPMAGNPGNTVVSGGEDLDHASWQVVERVSWWVLFVVRQVFILLCVKSGEILTIDILALRTPLFLRTVGSFATLMIVQARGWPYVLTFWSLSDFCFLFGNHAFARHWLFWQDWIDLFNESNPAGSFLHSVLYIRILCAMLFVGLFTSLKRLWLAFSLGRRSYAHYGPELEVILGKMLLVSQVAHLARQIEAEVQTCISPGYAYTMRTNKIALPDLRSESEDEVGPSLMSKSNDELSQSNSKGEAPQNGFGQSLLDAGIGRKFVDSLSRPKLEKTPSQRNLLVSTRQLGSSAKLEIMALLEEWEEPTITANAKSKASIKDILHFRQAVAMMDDTYPFTPAFGPAKTRAMCVESSEKLFEMLQAKTPDTSPLLPFETLSEIAFDANGQLVREKAKALIRLFRPDRKGFLTKLDFVSSTDDVYKELRLFRASLANSSSIDDSFETIINFVFYFLVIIVVLIIVGFQMWEPILSFSAFFFSFSFMFGPASSKYFSGILLIFVRRPYDIGDKIALSDPESDTRAAGSSTWFVERVSLYTTTVRFATTNEVATYSNGSLAGLRIINAKRSPKAIIYVFMKFGSDVPFQMIKVYQTAIENFVKGRPREWAQLNGFRATRVEMELNYIEYVIVATHREMWQNVGPILQSQADLASFSLEVSKKLNLRYENPPKPINLSMNNDKKTGEGEDYSLKELAQVARLFGTGGGVAAAAVADD